MRDPARVEVAERPRPGKCPLCGHDWVLTHQVEYYRVFRFLVCRVCGTALARHLRWVAEARLRHLRNRIVRAVDGE